MRERKLIKAGTIICPDRIIKGDLLIEDDHIVEIGEVKRGNIDEIIDAKGKVIIPGFVHAHVHLCQTMFRGRAEDLELLEWLEKKIFPFEAMHDSYSVYWTSLLSLAELIRCGATTICDFASILHTDREFEAMKAGGIRAKAGNVLMDIGEKPLAMDKKDLINKSMDLFREWNSGRVEYLLVPRFVLSCSEELLLEVKELSDRYDLEVTTHAAENLGEVEQVIRERGARNIEYFERIGLTSPKLILAHCIHLSELEVKILKDKQVKVVHCPSANLKLRSGIARISELIEMGISVSLGSDGAACNNNLNMFIEMRLAALLQNYLNIDINRNINQNKNRRARTITAKRAFEMATIEGARALRLEKEIGSIETGKKADLVILDLNKVNTTPSSDIFTTIVYSTDQRNVESVMIDGRWVMKDTVLKTIDEEEVLKRCSIEMETETDIEANIKKLEMGSNYSSR